MISQKVEVALRGTMTAHL